MKKILSFLIAGILGATAGIALAQFTPGTVLTATALNAALAAPTITAGSINGVPIGASTPSTGAFTTLSTTSDATFGGVNVSHVNNTVDTTSLSTSAVNTNLNGPNTTATRSGTLSGSGGTVTTAAAITANHNITSGVAQSQLFGLNVGLNQNSSGKAVNLAVGVAVTPKTTGTSNVSSYTGVSLTAPTQSSTGAFAGTIIGFDSNLRNTPATDAAADIYHFAAENGAGTVNSVTGFISYIDAGTNHWAFYASGGAASATSGKLAVGSVTAPTDTVDVTGSIRATQYVRTTAPNTRASTTYTVVDTDNWIISNQAATLTLTLPTPANYIGRSITVKTIQAQTVVSASSNVAPLNSTSASTPILAATAGKWATLVSDGTSWVIMAGN